ncbi:MAG: DUF4358 domain-containing protein [Lachnospiraceae bacterium]|nr:DUF4358 domain-containing protein [Lachnospiraceae bacterium]
MRKKILCMALVGAMTLSMAACGGKDKESDPTPTPSTVPTQEAGEPTPEPTTSEEPTQAPSQFEDFDVAEMVDGILERVETPAMMPGSDMELTEIYGIPAEKVDAYAIRIPMMNVTATEISAFRAATEEDVQAIVDGINARVQSLTSQWESYLQDQLELVQNHKLLVQGRYVLFVIGDDELSSYAENVFMRKFDPSIEEMVLVRKFREFQGIIKELSEDKIVLEYTEEDKVYTFECKYAEYFYAEGGLENFAVGDTVECTLEEPVPEAEGTMQASLNYMAKTME